MKAHVWLFGIALLACGEPKTVCGGAECGKGDTTETDEVTDSDPSDVDPTDEEPSDEDLTPECENGVREDDEACDGTDFGGASCVTEGFQSGALSCTDGCAIDTSACSHDIVCEELAPLVGNATCEVEPGDTGILLRGVVLSPDGVMRGGQVLVAEDGTIACVGCNCASLDDDATVVTCPSGVISPGLVNAHDHPQYATGDRVTDTGERYEHRHQWRLGLDTRTQYSPLTSNTAANALRWNEVRMLLGGATSRAWSNGAQGLLRFHDVTVDTYPLDDNDGTRRQLDCDYGEAPTTSEQLSADEPYVGHVAEGIDASSHNELACISSTTYDVTEPGVSHDLLGDGRAFAGMSGSTAQDYATLAASGSMLAWTPRANILTYGNTVSVALAHRLGVPLALGTEWVVAGSRNMLSELHCADSLNTTYFDGALSDRELWLMATENAAALIGATNVGVLAAGYFADITIFNGATRDAYRAVLGAEAEDVVLVLRGGEPLYGDTALMDDLTTGCDLLDVCDTTKRVCLNDAFGVSFATLSSNVTTSVPAIACSFTTEEPSCTPSRSVSISGSTTYTGQTSTEDLDGDGIANASDNCPRVFNPARPMDGGMQADTDTDGVGDVCDVCPFVADAEDCQ